MNIYELLELLFEKNYKLKEEGETFFGSGVLNNQKFSILGTKNDTYISNDIALNLSNRLLKIIQNDNKEPILILADSLGQKLCHHDELLGINLYLAHLSKCIELARLRGHKMISILRNQAVSGGALCTNLLADSCYALDDASIGVMNLPSMSRITQIPLKKLKKLSETSPLFDTNVNNYYVMGALEGLWNKNDDLPKLLFESINSKNNSDERATLGSIRKGRLETLKVLNLVLGAN